VVRAERRRMVSLVDARRQWLTGRVGLDAAQTPRDPKSAEASFILMTGKTIGNPSDILGVDSIPRVIPPTLAIEGESRRFPVRRVFCIGRNYRSGESRNTDGLAREAPYFFMKPADAVVPAAGVIAYPPLTIDFCHEIELVVAIGRGGSEITSENALSHVWGYAAGLDLTRRDLQAEAKARGLPWEGAKAFDGSAPCGALVPVAVAGHPSSGAIWLTVNGVDRQRADLAELIWPVPDLIAFLSRSVALAAGDLVFTGTPSGVGPLLVGDIVRAGIEGVGEITMVVEKR
jgi:fumarylpyruvate hydrolase